MKNSWLSRLKSKDYLVKLGVYAFILLLPFGIFYWQAPFLGDLSIGNDYPVFNRYQMELQYSLKHGSFPLYVPGFAKGQTSAALTMGQVYHPISHLASFLPGYWQGKSLECNTFLRLLLLGLVHLGLFILLGRLRLNPILSFIISFITVYNLRMMDLFRYYASLENYTGYLFLCIAIAFYYLKPTRFIGPASMILATYLFVCGGHPQMMYLGLIGTVITVVFIPFILRKISSEIEVNRQRLIKYFTTVGACFSSGLLLSSAYIFPFYFDFVMENGLRVVQSYQWSLKYSDTIGGMLNSFFAPLHSDVHGAFGSSSIIILIVLVPLLYSLRIKVPVTITVLWGILVVIFLISLGGATPIHYLFWKYFPLANTFRIPGRIVIIFPFLFLLILAWLFRSTDEKVSLGSRQLPVSSGQFLSLIAIPLFILYNWGLVKYLPKPNYFIPMHIKPYPQWVDSWILYVGVFSLILVALYLSSIKLFKKGWSSAIGILLSITVVVQVGTEIRYGTFVVERPPQPSLASMDKQIKKKLTSYAYAGYGMESMAVVTQMRHSILEPALAKFYRKYKIVSNQDEAYRFLNKENVTDTIVVEGACESVNFFRDHPQNLKSNNHDRLSLKESSFNRVLFSVEAVAPGFFALSYPYSGKWTARIDGNRVRANRANGYMYGVYLDAGLHNIEFRYWSQAAFVGMLTSCLTFFFTWVYFAFFAFGKKRKLQILVLIISILVSVGLFWGWYSSLYSSDNLETKYTWSSKEFPPGDNLAYAKKTMMGPVGNSFYAGLGVDGVIGKPFRTRKRKKGWWQVDLGAPKQIGKIIIYDGKFSGKKHLPFKILGSIDGKNFKLLKIITTRGSERPWSIHMNGEITRFVRLKSVSRGSLSFREIEIYPPLDAEKEKALLDLVHSEPITKELQKKISLINQAVDEKNANTLKTLLEKEKNVSKEIKRILTFSALRKAIENDCPDIIKILRDGGAKLSSCTMDIKPQKIIDILKDKKIKYPIFKEFNIWNPLKKNKKEISPFLHIQGKRGEFKFEFKREKERNILIVSNVLPDKKGERLYQFGYSANKNGFNIEIPEGRFVSFIVRAKIPKHLVNKDNHIFIQDFDGKWERKKIFFSGNDWKTFLISKIVRKNSTHLNIGLSFVPQSAEDKLMIKDMKIFVSNKEL